MHALLRITRINGVGSTNAPGPCQLTTDNLLVTGRPCCRLLTLLFHQSDRIAEVNL